MRKLLSLMFIAALAAASQFEPIKVDGGLIIGTPSPQWTYGIHVFRGIPFAAPPVGPLRWRSPQLVVPWQGVKETDHYSPVCMQAPTVKESNAWQEGLTPVSEDCLYLNIWTPAQSENDNLAVMMFIPGGGNTRGAASELQYVWNNPNLKDWPWTFVDHSLGELMSSLWTNFAKTGNPNGPGLPEWPAYDAKNEKLLYITTGAKSQALPYESELEFLSKAADVARKR